MFSLLLALGVNTAKTMGRVWAVGAPGLRHFPADGGLYRSLFDPAAGAGQTLRSRLGTASVCTPGLAAQTPRVLFDPFTAINGTLQADRGRVFAVGERDYASAHNRSANRLGGTLQACKAPQALRARDSTSVFRVLDRTLQATNCQAECNLANRLDRLSTGLCKLLLYKLQKGSCYRPLLAKSRLAAATCSRCLQSPARP